MLQQAIQSSGIDYLLHFTRIENLPSILMNGLIPRSTLEASNSPLIFNDPLRLDGYKNALCCSIQHPNYKMFFSLRQQNPNTEWVVLGINTNILWQKNVAFCYTNAANSAIRSTHLEDLTGVGAFNKLFENINMHPTRAELKLPNNYPTDPQAEILVFDIIEPQHIIGVVFKTPQHIELYKNLFPGRHYIQYSQFFSPRYDYQSWTNQNGI